MKVEVEAAPKAVEEVEVEERRVDGAWTLGGAGQGSKAGAAGRDGVEVGALGRTGEEAPMERPGQLGRRDRAQEMI